MVDAPNCLRESISHFKSLKSNIEAMDKKFGSAIGLKLTRFLIFVTQLSA